MKKEKSYQEEYDEFWKPIIEKDGVVDMEQVKKELSDFSFMLEQVPKVYCEVTGCRISKPNTYAFEVISEFNNLFWSKSTPAEDIADIINGDGTAEDKLEEIKEYLEIQTEET